ncbi:MAG: hypothetical protein M9958_00815 [Chitinophagales bacterium]|nr:hypothetical protein [Chitinophagales bacterium]
MANQYILGINGLGISPSACLIKDGQLIAMVEEERFTRQKNSNSLMPGNAVAYCLKEANISIKDVEQIAFAWDANFYKYKIYWFLIKQFIKRFFELRSSSSNILRVFQEVIKYHPLQVKNQIREMFRTHGISDKLPPIQFVSHHYTHATSTFFASPFNEATVLVIDGSGENLSTSIWKGENHQLKLMDKYFIPDSLGWFYQTMTEFLGFTPNHHEGKVMALAAYGNYNKDIDEALKKVLQIFPNGRYQFNPSYSFSGKNEKGVVFSTQLENLLGPSRKPNEEITQFYKDIAFHTQGLLENAVKSILLNISTKKWYSPNICIAGGVGLNCKMNGKIASLSVVNDIFVPPFSSDIGTSYGAAIAITNKKIEPLNHAYWGPEYNDNYIYEVLKKYNIPHQKVEDIAGAAAHLLMENKIIAWFQGRMEVGARALGARSIIANPTISSNKDFINKHIKNRETWRPFAISILEEHKHQFIDTSIDAPFMSIAFDVNEYAINNIPAAIHIDNTSRPQFVKKSALPIYWELINRFGELSGVYALLNTSFNLKEEPIICSPEQAIRSFYTSELDVLIMGNYLIFKPQ